jgi:hypothetical protein
MAGATVTVKSGIDTEQEEALRAQVANIVLDLEAVRVGVAGGDGIVTIAAALAIGTTKTDVANVTSAIQLRGSGAIAVASAETAFTDTTHDIADIDANPREAWYAFSVQADGSTITITQGVVAEADLAVKPAAPAGEVILGWVKVQHDGSLLFDANSDDLDAAHLTVTYEDAPVLTAAALVAAQINVN